MRYDGLSQRGDVRIKWNCAYEVLSITAAAGYHCFIYYGIVYHLSCGQKQTHTPLLDQWVGHTLVK